MSSFNKYLEKQLENPEFKAEYEKLSTISESWIPIRKRFPDKNGFYLATLILDLGDVVTEPVVYCKHNDQFYYLVDYYHNDFTENGLDPIGSGEGEYWNNKVIAWRPYPKPYKEA